MQAARLGGRPRRPAGRRHARDGSSPRSAGQRPNRLPRREDQAQGRGVRTEADDQPARVADHTRPGRPISPKRSAFIRLGTQSWPRTSSFMFDRLFRQAEPDRPDWRGWRLSCCRFGGHHL